MKKALQRLFASVFLFTWATFAVLLGIQAKRQQSHGGAAFCFLAAAFAAGFAIRELFGFFRQFKL